MQRTGRVGRRYHMVLQENDQPSVRPAQCVPLVLREPLKDELQRMVKHGIIEQVDGPTDLGNSIGYSKEGISNFKGMPNPSTP